MLNMIFTHNLRFEHHNCEKKNTKQTEKILMSTAVIVFVFWDHLSVDLPSRFRIFCMLRHTNSIITICKTIEIVLNLNAHFSAHVHKRVDDVQNPNIKRPQYMKCCSTQFRWHCITLGHTIHFFFILLYLTIAIIAPECATLC